jgi:3-hydroxyacyl-[acyl-carrier-protein] dehydratase
MRFILVDRILSLEPGVSIEAQKTMPASEEFFLDHFPGFPVVPGVLLTEMMAQAAGKVLDTEDAARGRAMLGEIRSARFRSWMRPDETATIFASIVKSQADFAVARCHIKIADRKICSAELMFAFVPRNQFAPDYVDEVLATYLASRASAPAGPT